MQSCFFPNSKNSYFEFLGGYTIKKGDLKHTILTSLVFVAVFLHKHPYSRPPCLGCTPHTQGANLKELWLLHKISIPGVHIRKYRNPVRSCRPHTSLSSAVGVERPRLSGEVVFRFSSRKVRERNVPSLGKAPFFQCGTQYVQPIQIFEKVPTDKEWVGVFCRPDQFV